MDGCHEVGHFWSEADIIRWQWLTYWTNLPHSKNINQAWTTLFRWPVNHQGTTTKIWWRQQIRAFSNRQIGIPEIWKRVQARSKQMNDAVLCSPAMLVASRLVASIFLGLVIIHRTSLLQALDFRNKPQFYWVWIKRDWQRSQLGLINFRHQRTYVFQWEENELFSQSDAPLLDYPPECNESATLSSYLQSFFQLHRYHKEANLYRAVDSEWVWLNGEYIWSSEHVIWILLKQAAFFVLCQSHSILQSSQQLTNIGHQQFLFLLHHRLLQISILKLHWTSFIPIVFGGN